MTNQVPILRPLERRDLCAVLDLNQRNVTLLSPLDEARLMRLLDWADRADVIELDTRLAGFVLTFAPGSDYDGRHYAWFSGYYGDDFYYLDRIVLDDDFRRRGLGRFVYDEIERAAASYGRMALEVNVSPPNVPSLSFHAARGYTEVGRLGENEEQVALLAKVLPR